MKLLVFIWREQSHSLNFFSASRSLVELVYVKKSPNWEEPASWNNRICAHLGPLIGFLCVLVLVPEPPSAPLPCYTPASSAHFMGGCDPCDLGSVFPQCPSRKHAASVSPRSVGADSSHWCHVNQVFGVISSDSSSSDYCRRPIVTPII